MNEIVKQDAEERKSLSKLKQDQKILLCSVWEILPQLFTCHSLPTAEPVIFTTLH